MVGIFSRLSVRSNHRRTQSALDERAEFSRISSVATNNSTTIDSTASNNLNNGIEIAFGFEPLEHPTEPIENDQPILCPLPDPTFLNVGSIWNGRESSSVQTKADMVSMQEEGSIGPRAKPRPRNRATLPSVSAPEHNISLNGSKNEMHLA